MGPSAEESLARPQKLTGCLNYVGLTLPSVNPAIQPIFLSFSGSVRRNRIENPLLATDLRRAI